MAQSQDDAKLELRVVDAHGVVNLMVKKSTKFRKILAALIVDGIDPDTIRMMVDGQRVNLEQCPGDYDMESGDQIDCMAQRPPPLGKTSIDGPILDRLTVTVTVTNVVFGTRSQVEISFRRSPTSPLHSLFETCASSQNIRLESLCWSFDGMAVRGDQTPADLGLEAGGQLDLVAALTRSPPPGGLLPELLQKVLEFLPLDKVLGAKRVSFCWREAGISAITRGRWKPVNWVAVHGEHSMLRETMPASELTDCRAAWDLDPNETLRILFAWGGSYRRAARFLAIVEPSLEGLERIVILLEPVQRFFYAKRQLHVGGGRMHVGAQLNPANDVISKWAALIGNPGLHSNPDVVLRCISRALRSWTDASVALSFLNSGRERTYRLNIPGEITRGWEDSKASALTAADVAFVARCTHGPTRAERGLAPAILRVEQLLGLLQLQPEQLVRYASNSSRNHSYLDRVVTMCRRPGNYY